jgi:hypothetical protein
MRDTIGTLESERVQPQASEMNEGVETIRGKKVRFAYASGARPLSGYTIKRGIGVGGFGEVYFAISDSGKEVALKHIKRNLDIELRGVRQCLNLKHVNLISLWDICTTDAGESWVVMEYVPGDSLRDAIDRHPGGMPIEEVQRWFRSAAAGVSYLHNNGIVHRDLKPGNIFYDADEDVVKIGDYGLSKFISCSRRSGQTESVGTFHYMAPEIGKGVYGKEIDIYALGIILYEMLCGRLPFDGESSQEIIMKHLTADVNLDPVPAAYRSAIRRALAKDPDERFHSIDELLSEIPSRESEGGAAYVSPPANGAVHRSRTPPRVAGQAPLGAGVPSGERETYYIGDDADIRYGAVQGVVDADIIDNPDEVKVLGVSWSAARNEPIARAIASTYRTGVERWNQSKLGTPAKTIILVIAAIILIANSAYLLPLGLMFAVIYFPYLAIRAWVTAPSKKTTKSRKVSRRAVINQMRQSLLERSPAERLSDLTGALLKSSIVALVVGVVTGTVYAPDSSVGGWTFAAWVTLSSALASWAVLACGKTWELSSGENIVRRFWMLTIGLLVGLFSFGVAQSFELGMVADSHSPGADFLAESLQARLVDSNGFPTLASFLLFFGANFAALRWWRQADPTRKTRLSLWSVCVCGVAAVLFSELFRFPQIAGCLVIVATTIAVQLAAPWINHQERRQYRMAAMKEA